MLQPWLIKKLAQPPRTKNENKAVSLKTLKNTFVETEFVIYKVVQYFSVAKKRGW